MFDPRPAATDDRVNGSDFMDSLLVSQPLPDGDEAYSFRVLVVAYYFPPMGLSGVQRVSKFVKYLPAYRWKPTVLTAKVGSYFAFDPSLLAELEAEPEIVIRRTDSADPTRLFGRTKELGLPSERIRRLTSWFSQLLFIPDNKIGWKNAAVEEGKRIIDAQHHDVIFASAPPYTSLLVGLELSRWSGIPLIADFRDDWVGNPRHRYPTPIHRRRHLRMEKDVVEHAMHVTTINRVIQGRLVERHLGASGYNRVSILPQGFDPADFRNGPLGIPHGKFRLLYSGVFYDAQQPDVFLCGLARWLERQPQVRPFVEARFVGMMPHHARRLIDRLRLSDVVSLQGYLSHAEAVAELQEATVLWMTVGKQRDQETISTGKLYEYFGTRKPILGLVPEGAARRALKEYQAAELVEPEDVDGVVAAMQRLYQQWQTHSLPAPEEELVRKFDRGTLAGDLARLLVSTVKAE